MSAEELEEHRIRQLRKAVFGRDCTGVGWDAVKKNWRQPDALRWLEEKASQPLKDYEQNPITKASPD